MKRIHYKSLVAAAVINSFTQTAFAETLAPIGATQDTWTKEGSGTNYGGQSTLRIDTHKMQAFIQFTVSDIPDGHTVDTAILTLTAQGNSVNVIPDTYIAPVTGIIWDEMAVNGNNDDDLLSATGSAIASATNIDVGSTVDFNIASGISGNGVYTFMIDISDTDVTSTKYYSSSSNAAYRPQLTITTQFLDLDPVLSIPTNITVGASNGEGTLATNPLIAEFLTSVSATDDLDGNIDVSHNAPSLFILGDNVVTFTAIDSAGNEVSAQATITISDQAAPVITLVGDSSLTLNAMESYVEAGATAVDNVDGDISENITISGDTVDTSAPGIYKVTYNVKDEAANSAAQLTRTITVQDSTAPVVIAPENITVEATSPSGTEQSNDNIVVFLGAATAEDAVDGPRIASAMDAPAIFDLGDNLVTFTASDEEGNIGTSEATITVVDTTAPLITLTGDSTITIALGKEYSDAGAIVTDIFDNNVALVVEGIDAIDTAIQNTYTITYDAVDSEGNEAKSVTRSVIVQNEQAPTITPPQNITVATIDANGIPFDSVVFDAFFNDASAVDFSGADIDVSHDGEGFAPLNVTTTVTFSATDGKLVGTATATVTVTDQTAPVITLAGGDIEITVGDNYLEPGISAIDNVDGDLSGSITVLGAVDTAAAGIYTLTYDVSDNAGNISKQMTREIIVSEPVLLDRDGDGVFDDEDVFPDDASETTDSDLDGVGDNADFAPYDKTESSDSDGDGTGDNADIFPFDATEALDTDGDKIGNNIDIDDDNDGIIDTEDSASLDASIGDVQAPNIQSPNALTIEATGELTQVNLVAPQVTDNNLNAPSIVADLSQALPLGTHKVNWTATDFAGNKTTAQQLLSIVDTTAPEFALLTSKTINARGLITDITADINVVATDSVDGELSASLVGNGKYGAGSHTVNLMVNDSAGNTAYAEKIIHINPIVAMDRGVNLAPGSHYILPVILSDKAAHYPVTISYELSGAVADNTGANPGINPEISSGEIIIEEGLTGQIEFTVTKDAVTNDLIKVTLVSASNAVIVEESSHFSVIEENSSPTLSLSVEQNGQPISIIDATSGMVTVKAIVSDINPLDEHQLTWSFDNNALVDLAVDESALTFEFSPEQLEPGPYDLSLTLVETNTDESLAVTLVSRLLVEAALVGLSDETDSDNDGIADSDEGYNDSDNDGIADYLDNDSNVSRLPLSPDAEPMQTVNGLTLSLGDIVRQASNVSAEDASISLEALADNGGENGTSADNVTNTNFTPISTIINFNINGLTQTGESVPVVIPLADNQYIPQNAVYKKYTLSKGWFDFVEDANNTIASTMTDNDGNCPPPLAEVYSDALTAGDNCIQLMIEDGGPNDADNQANGVIKDPGVLAINGANEAPVINLIGELTTDENRQVTLDASTSTDADENDLTYQWTQTAGSEVILTGQDSAVLSFMAPSVTHTKALSFSLAVNDGSVTSTKTFTVLVNNLVIINVAIDAHNDQFTELTSVTLEADVNLNSLFVPSYLWQQVSGPEVNLSDVDVTAASLKFIAPQVTTDEVVEFSLTVSRGETDVSTTTSFTVVKAQGAVESPVDEHKKKSSGGSMAWLLVATSLLLRLRRRGIQHK